MESQGENVQGTFSDQPQQQDSMSNPFDQTPLSVRSRVPSEPQRRIGQRLRRQSRAISYTTRQSRRSHHSRQSQSSDSQKVPLFSKKQAVFLYTKTEFDKATCLNALTQLVGTLARGYVTAVHYTALDTFVFCSFIGECYLSCEQACEAMKYRQAVPQIVALVPSARRHIVDSAQWSLPEKLQKKLTSDLSLMIQGKQKEFPIVQKYRGKMKASNLTAETRLANRQMMIRQDRAVSLPKQRGIWISGPADSGKSTAARELAKEWLHTIDVDEQPYIKAMDTHFFEGYVGQKVIILDDISPDSNKATFEKLRTLINVIPAIVDVKNGSAKSNPHLVIATSQYTPAQVARNENQLSAWTKRFIFLCYAAFNPGMGAMHIPMLSAMDPIGYTFTGTINRKESAKINKY